MILFVIHCWFKCVRTVSNRTITKNTSSSFFDKNKKINVFSDFFNVNSLSEKDLKCNRWPWQHHPGRRCQEENHYDTICSHRLTRMARNTVMISRIMCFCEEHNVYGCHQSCLFLVISFDEMLACKGGRPDVPSFYDPTQSQSNARHIDTSQHQQPTHPNEKRQL